MLDSVQGAVAADAPPRCETYAANAEDLIVESLLAVRFAAAQRDLGSMFYIEIGAAHPTQPSNTYLFYRKHAAAGALVAAHEGMIDDLRRVRPRDTVLQAAGVMVHRTDGPVDLLAIDTPNCHLDILASLDFSICRPLIIQCRTGNDPSATTRFLTDQAYTLAARTQAALIFTDSTAPDTAPPPRPFINSFDVFDTLIARRCIHPHIVFAELEAANGIEGFARHRVEAEQAVTGPHMTLADIYTELGRRLGLTKEATAEHRQAEIDAELAQVIPIHENLARVRHGDLLLSDMYLPPEVIRTLLDKAGLNRRVGLIVSADGKKSGRIWPQVKAGFTIGRHLGDNLIADVAMPQHFAIATEHTNLSEPSQIERFFLANGLRPLAELVRAARLRITTPDPVARRLLWVETQYNFPIMLLTSVVLRRHAAATGVNRLLFSSRDCYLWHALYRTLFPDATGAEYFYTSRRVRVDPSTAYRAYARERLTPDSLLIDLCGTGWSSARLLETLGLQDRGLFFLHRIPPMEAYEQQYPTPDICRIYALLGPERENLHIGRLEMCNYAQHTTVIGLQMAGGAPVPVFDMEDRSPTQLALVTQIESCFRAMAADPAAVEAARRIWLSTPEIAEVVAALYALLCLETCVPNAFAASHRREDEQVMSAMKLSPPK
jgi:hypothetical protein